MTRLMSFCARPTVAAKKRGDGADDVTKPLASGARSKHLARAADHEDAGGDHGGGVDQRRDRRRAFHRVRQPDVQEELRRLAHRADEQQQEARP